MEITPRLTNFLTHHLILYEVVRVPDEIRSLGGLGQLGLPPRSVVKTIPFHRGAEVMLLVLPTECEIDPKRIASLFGAPLARPCTLEEMARAFPDCEPGAIPPMGEPYGASVYVDRCVPIHRRIAFPGGSWRQLIRLPYSLFDLLAQPVPVGVCRKCQGCGTAKVISALRR